MIECLDTEYRVNSKEMDTFLGLVMYFIHEHFIVPKHHLVSCIIYIQRMLDGTNHEDGWSNYEGRLEALRGELVELEKALNQNY